MGILEKHAKGNKQRQKTRTVNARLPIELANRFDDHCERLGLTITEAFRILVENELQTNENKMQTLQTNLQTNENKAPTYENNQGTQIVKKSTSSGGKRFNMNPYKLVFPNKRGTMSEQIPCPICDEWVIATNAKRDHTIEHHGGIGAPEMVQQDLEEAAKMVERKKKELGMQ